MRRQIEEEKGKLGEAEENVVAIEYSYEKALLSVGVPGTTQDDRVEINRRTWISQRQLEMDTDDN